VCSVFRLLPTTRYFISWQCGLCRHLLSMFSVSSDFERSMLHFVIFFFLRDTSGYGAVLFPKLRCLCMLWKITGTNKIQIFALKRGVTSSENKFKLLPAQGHYILSQRSWIFKSKLIYWSQDSIVATKTRLQTACPWSLASVHSKNFLSSPNLRDRLRYPPSFLLNLQQFLFPQE